MHLENQTTFSVGGNNGNASTNQVLWRLESTAGTAEVSAGAAAVKAVEATRARMESLENILAN